MSHVSVVINYSDVTLLVEKEDEAFQPLLYYVSALYSMA